MTEEVDAVVVGGGIAGASCLYHLARHGLAAVLLERGSLARGSTGRSTALIETAYADPERVELCMRTLRGIRTFCSFAVIRAWMTVYAPVRIRMAPPTYLP